MLIPLHANVPSHFSYNPVATAGQLSMVYPGLAINDVFATLKQKFGAPVNFDAPEKTIAPRRLSAFDVERSMSNSQLLNRWNGYVAEASRRFRIPESWIRAVIRMESGGRTMLSKTQPIVSRVGAIGLMQLMPETYKEMRKAQGLGANAADPHDNILAGTAYLSWLHDKYGYPAMFAAYNAGPGKLEDHLSRGVSLPDETVHYVSGITGSVASAGDETGMAQQKSLFHFAKLTQPNGRPIYVSSAKVASVRVPLPGEYAPGVRAIVKIGRRQQAVRESVMVAKAMIRASGGMV